MNLRRLKAIATKEFIHVLRDPRSLMMGIGMPLPPPSAERAR